MEFTKNGFDLFRKSLKDALAPVEEEYGIAIRQGNITYDDGERSFTLKLDAYETSRNGETVDRDKVLFERYCAMFSLKPEHYRAECRVGTRDTAFLIAGIDPGARSKNIIIERISDGKRYKCQRCDIRLFAGDSGKEDLTGGLRVRVVSPDDPENDGPVAPGEFRFTLTEPPKRSEGTTGPAKAEEDSPAEAKERAEFESFCYQYGFQPEDYKAKCHAAFRPDVEYRLVGFNPNARVNFLILERIPDKKRFRSGRKGLVFEKKEASA